MSLASYKHVAGCAFTLVLSLASGAISADYGYNLQHPVTPIATEIFHLHNTIFFICLAIFVAVFAVMFYSILVHRKSRGAKPATFRESTAVEIMWTTIPFLILIAMAIPSTATLLKMEDTKTNANLIVKVTGYQWKWHYEYLGHNVSYFSTLATSKAQIDNQSPKQEHYLLEVDNPLVLPVGKKIRFILTANDVIHSWWVPALGVKKDAVPGFITESWTRIAQPGIYRGQCAELCGKDHGFMPIVVEAKTDAEFNDWLAKQKSAQIKQVPDTNKVWTKDELMARGEKVYANCVACHGSSGAGVPGVFPALTSSKLVTGPVSDHLNVVMKGRPGTAMQSFADQLSDVDIAAVVTYERNALGNSVGDLVQPSQVSVLR